MWLRRRRLLLISVVLYIINFCTAKPFDAEISSKVENDNKIESSNGERAKYAKEMLSYMNQSVDPCEDFYEYACGNYKNVLKDRWVKDRPTNMLSISNSIADSMDEILQRSSLSLDQNYDSEFKLAKTFYQDCLAADLKPTEKSIEYMAVINSLGGFPAIDETWNPDNFSWFNMSSHLSNYGITSLINEGILPMYPFGPYFKKLELGFGFIMQNDTIQSKDSMAYRDNETKMRKYLKLYGVSETKTEETISEIFDLWKEILTLDGNFTDGWDACPLPEPDYNLVFPEWDNYFEIAWNGKSFNSTLEEKCCNYFYIELDKICRNRKRAVANFLAMQFLLKMDAELKSTSYQKEYCIDYTQRMALFLLDEVYLKDYLPEDTRTEVSNFLDEIRQTMRSTLEEADWLDEETRSKALQKLSEITIRIGKYKDAVLTDRLIREMNKLSFVEGNFERNNMNVNKFKTLTDRYVGLNSETFDNSTKPMETVVATQINAFYYVFDNSINVLAGILRSPVFHKTWPNSLKFGTLGYLVGHEFTHGFDTPGAPSEIGDGENNRWTEKSEQAFNDRASCYVKHYDRYFVPEINRYINGNQTLRENIADSGGIKVSLLTYRKLMKAAKESGDDLSRDSEQMPGMDHSPEQLYFLGFAQLWCNAFSEEDLWKIIGDDHAVDNYRVLGTLTNYDEFALAFNCPVGSKMNPSQEKCKLW